MNIYIANLSSNVEDNDLMQLFEGYGEVSSAKVIMDKFTGRSRGFGFVEMSDNEAAQKAIDELNNAEHDGKTIVVNEANPPKERPARSNNRGGYGGNNDRRRGGGDRGYGDRNYGDRGYERREKRW